MALDQGHAGQNRRGRRLVRAVVVAVTLASGPPVFAQATPSTGATVAEFAPVDQAVLEFMDRIDCQAGAAAVSRQGKLQFSRGYGWSDAHKKKLTAPDTLMRIAGLTQSITAAAVKQLIREGKFALDTKAFKLLDLKPPHGSSPDPRLDRITVAELLEHRAGWDAGNAFDPFTRLREIEKRLRLSRRPRPVDVVRYMLAEPLQFDPGQRMVRSNFGYCVLGRVIEKASGKPYGTYIMDDIFRPLGVNDVKLARSLPRDPREVWYPVKDVVVEVADSYGGLVASAPDLCKFLEAYWANGDPRRPGEDLQWAFVGNFAGTTAYVRQRPDGYNIALLFNGRRKGSLQDEDDRALQRLVDEAIDKVAAAVVK